MSIFVRYFWIWKDKVFGERMSVLWKEREIMETLFYKEEW
jgi:hypothetical protein